MDETVKSRVEAVVDEFIKTPGRHFGKLRRSNVVPLDVLRLGATEHPSAVVRRECVVLLDHLDGEDSARLFVQILLNDPVPRVRKHALHALTCEKCKDEALCFDVVPALVSCAESDENENLRLGALHALKAYLPDQRAERVLRALARPAEFSPI